MARFDRKVAIVTGAASGIGKEIALRFAAEGGTPVIADLNLDAADATAARSRPKARDAFAVAMNVADEDAVEQGRRRHDGEIWPHRHAGLQRRHPDRQAGRRLRFCRLEEAAGDPSRRRLPDHQGLPQAHVRSKVGQHHLHGLGPFQGGVGAEGALCHRQARADRLVQGRGQGRRRYNVRANVVCPGFVRTPLVDKQIPEQAKELGISEDDVIKNVMLKDTVDGEFTTIDDVAEAALFFAGFRPTR